MTSRYLLYIMVALVFIFSAALVLDAPGDVCNPNGYTGGAGEWIIDPADNECWYLHSIPEFDMLDYYCKACHDGEQASHW